MASSYLIIPYPPKEAFVEVFNGTYVFFYHIFRATHLAPVTSEIHDETSL